MTLKTLHFANKAPPLLQIVPAVLPGKSRKLLRIGNYYEDYDAIGVENHYAIAAVNKLLLNCGSELRLHAMASL